MRRSPLSSLIIIFTLALGIGANTCVFSVINGVLLRPLPYPEANRLVVVEETAAENREPQSVSYPSFQDWRRETKSFESLAVYSQRSLNVIVGGEPERVSGEIVSAQYFAVLGVTPQIGRAFLPEEDLPGAANLMVISSGFWRRYFGEDRQAIGRSVKINDRDFTVVGILPAGFRPLSRTADIWISLGATPIIGSANLLTIRGAAWLGVVGRLRQGVMLAQAREEMQAVGRVLEQQYPATHKGRGTLVSSLGERTGAKSRDTLLLLFGAVAALLLIACVNVATLMMAQNARREREILIRFALGASSRHVSGQLLIESVLLAVAGGVVGVLLAASGTSVIAASGIRDIPRLEEVSVDSRVLAFNFLLSLLVGLLFGLAPIFQVLSPRLTEALKEGGRGSAGVRATRTRGALLVAQIAFALVFLATAGLMLRSLWFLQRTDLGFAPERLLAVRLTSPSSSRYGDSQRIVAYYDRLLESLRETAVFQSVGAATSIPMIASGPTMGFTAPGNPAASEAAQPKALYVAASDDYFSAMRIPLLRGRPFSSYDRRETAPTAIVNQALVQMYFPNSDPLSAKIAISDAGPARQIVGVVANVRQQGPAQPPRPEIYVSYRQVPEGFASFLRSFPMNFAARSNEENPLAVSSARAAIRVVDARQALHSIRRMEEVVSDSVLQPRIHSGLLALFAMIALLLTAAGIYGVTVEMVTHRTREIGIRLALGAKRTDIFRMILYRILLLTSLGVGLGLCAALATSRLLRSLLPGVSAGDPVAFFGGVVLMAGVAFAASFVPTWKASNMYTVDALRYE